MTGVLAPPATPAATARTSGDRAPRLIASELRKILTINTWWLLGITLLVFTGLALLTNMASGNQQLDNVELAKTQPPPDFSAMAADQRPTAAEQQAALDRYRQSIDLGLLLGRVGANIFTSGQFFGLLLIAILGCLVVTNEYQHQTATATFLAMPRRTLVIFAKFAASVIFAVGAWAVTTIIDLGLGSAFFSANGYDIPIGYGAVWRAIGMNLLAFVLWAMLGVGIGVLLRSQIGATVTTVVLYLVSLPTTLLVFGLLRQYVFKTDAVWNYTVLVPSFASSLMVSDGSSDLLPDEATVQWWVGMLVLIGYGVLAGTIGTLITRRRDIS